MNHDTDAQTTYVFSRIPEEYERLVTLAQRNGENVRDACRRANVRSGQSVVEIGCGPVGGMHIFSEIVGETGRVVGIEVNPDSVKIANEILAASGCLMLQELLLTTPVNVHSDPPLAGLDETLNLLTQVMQKRGARPECAWDLHDIAASLGFRIISHRGFFGVSPAEAHAFAGLMKKTTLSLRQSAVDLGIATNAEIDQLVALWTENERQSFRLCCPGLVVELVAQIP